MVGFFDPGKIGQTGHQSYYQSPYSKSAPLTWIKLIAESRFSKTPSKHVFTFFTVIIKATHWFGEFRNLYHAGCPLAASLQDRFKASLKGTNSPTNTMPRFLKFRDLLH